MKIQTPYTICFSLILPILIAFAASIHAQTNFTGAGGVIPANDTLCVQMPVSNNNTPMDAVNGLAGICVDVNFPAIEDLAISVAGPSGHFTLLTCCGFGTGPVSGSICFRDGAAGFYFGGTGTFLPLFELGNFNSGTTSSGIWELCIVNSGASTGTLSNWSVTLGGPNVAPPMASMGNNQHCIVETCNMPFYDSGGPLFDYTANEVFTKTFCPPADGQCIRATINHQVEFFFDVVDVYDSDQFGVNYLGSVTGTGATVATSSNGCLTFAFFSDGIGEMAGWDAQITCVPCAAAVASSRPANDDCSGAIVLTGSGTNAGAMGCDMAAPNPWGTDTCSWITTENSVFYSFEVTSATAQPVTITLNNVACSGGANQLQMAMYDMDCNMAGMIGSGFYGCASGLGTVTLEANQPTLPNGTYMLVVDGNAGAVCNWDVQSTVLDVEWLNFEGRYVDAQDIVALKWMTGEETNNEGFWVQRSTDMKDWRNLGFVEASEDQGARHSYSFDDDYFLENGTYYYRLRQHDHDGKTTYSNIINVTVGVPGAFEILNQYPNPVSQRLNLEVAVATAGDVEVSVYDLQGRKVGQQRYGALELGYHTVVYPAESLSEGVYLYTMRMGSEEVKGKFVVQK